MAHHGNNPLEDVPSELKRKLMQTIGETHQYPQGKLTRSDEGELALAVMVKNGKIVMEFGKEIAWIGFDAKQAVELAELLLKRAREVSDNVLTMRIS